MDVAKPAGNKAQAPAAGADAQQAVETPSSSPEPDDAVAVAGCEEDDDDEQVERFYALLDNIRAMRGMLGGTAAAEAGRRKRRAREAAEPPWRPAFRMEDFEVVEEADSDSAAACGAAGHQRKKEKGKIVDGRRGRSAGCGVTRATAGDEEEDDGEAVLEEAEGPPRKAARRVAGW